jgi:lactate dehydrogenase-like 2-hydroxyacid dehydrogenase
MLRIAVTELEYRKVQDIFDAAGADGLACLPAAAAEAELAAFVREHGIQHVIIGVEPYRGALYEALPAGGVVARFGVGHDGVDKPLATTRGILCTNTPGALDDSVAEHALNLMLAAARHTATVATACKQGQWRPQVGRELRNRKLAVIGCGPIGCRVARIAAFGFGMQVAGCELRTVDTAARRQQYRRSLPAHGRRLPANIAAAERGDVSQKSLVNPDAVGFSMRAN